MKNVLITREKEQFEEVKKLFEKEGFNPISFPTIKFEKIPLEGFNEREFDFLIFTSKNAVKIFLQQVALSKSKPIIAVGSKTAKFLVENGFENVEIPDTFSSEGLKDYLYENIERFKNKKFALVRALEGSEVLLNQSEFEVKLIPVYKTVFNKPENIEEVEKMLKDKKIDAVVFSSPSTFKGFINVFGLDKTREFLEYPLVCAIGSVTEQEIKSQGIKVNIVPEKFTFEGILEELKKRWNNY